MRARDPMPVAIASIAIPLLDIVKMDDRKRPASDEFNHATPPLKRQAVSMNGSSSHADSDLPWKDDLDVSLSSGGIYASQEPYPA